MIHDDNIAAIFIQKMTQLSHNLFIPIQYTFKWNRSILPVYFSSLVFSIASTRRVTRNHFNICRNNSHSDILAYRERSCLSTKPSANGTDLWYDDYYKDYHRYNSERIHYDTLKNVKPHSSANDIHTIRIRVNGDDEWPAIHTTDRVDHNPHCIDVESVSNASVTIVEIGDTASSIASNTFEPDSNSASDSYVQTKNSRLIDTYHSDYNEKAIDVPEDFEREAYAAIIAQNDCSPFVRNIQQSLQVRSFVLYRRMLCIFSGPFCLGVLLILLFLW